MRLRNLQRWIPLGVVAATWLLTGLCVAAEDWDAPNKKWAKGPASYLLTEAEEKEYKKLKTDEERSAYVSDFWERRNPRAGELQNPFRARFLGRVERVDSLLKEQGIPAGWKSDLGRVLILLGQPDRFQFVAADTGGGAQDTSPAVPSADVGGGGGSYDQAGGPGGERQVKILMLYKDLTRLGLRKDLELELIKDGLTTRLETRVDLGTDAVRGLDQEVLAQEFPAGEEAPMEEFLNLGPATAEGGTPASLEEALTAPVAQSPQRELLLAALDGAELGETIPFDSTVDLYKARADKTYVAISLAITPEALAQHGGGEGLHPVAALRDQSDPDNLYLYDSDDLFAPSDPGGKAGSDGLVRYQAGDGVRPGTYTLITGWVDSAGEVSGLRKQDLEVPDFAVPAVRISSLTLAESWDAVDEPEGDLKRPFILANRRVVPKVKPVFAVNGDLALYYQIYNVAPEGSDPNLRIGYHVYRKRGSTFRKAATIPPLDGVTERVQIYELALAGWPAGDYKLKVNVTDNNSGAFDEREVVFHIE